MNDQGKTTTTSLSLSFSFSFLCLTFFSAFFLAVSTAFSLRLNSLSWRIGMKERE